MHRAVTPFLPCLLLSVFLLSGAAGVSAQVPGELGGSSALMLTAGSGGGLELMLSIEGEEASFLLDTGAAMATINSELFDRIRQHGAVRRTREVAARLADGRTRRLGVYEVGNLHLSAGCDLGVLEVIVVPGKGRNLLGLNALAAFAPLTLSMNPPALGLSGCSAPVTAGLGGSAGEPVLQAAAVPTEQNATPGDQLIALGR